MRHMPRPNETGKRHGITQMRSMRRPSEIERRNGTKQMRSVGLSRIKAIASFSQSESLPPSIVLFHAQASKIVASSHLEEKLRMRKFEENVDELEQARKDVESYSCLVEDVWSQMFQEKIFTLEACQTQVPSETAIPMLQSLNPVQQEYPQVQEPLRSTLVEAMSTVHHVFRLMHVTNPTTGSMKSRDLARRGKDDLLDVVKVGETIFPKNTLEWDSPGSRTIYEKLTREGPDSYLVPIGDSDFSEKEAQVVR
ncbi:hypothetical protein Bbelb_021270 [Branchiostoma belcheri]|nr:hypothetical protein Bbelb_021270 [Branchiostoma belcheri]